jgi:hypothetical protein
LCPYSHIIFSSHAKPICETELLMSPTIPKDCLLQQTHETLKVWHKLWTKNHWIFVLTDPTVLTINCNSKVSDVKLSNVGILTLTSNCKAYSPEVILLSENVNSSRVNMIIPNIDITKDDCCLETIINKSLNIPLFHPVHFSGSSLDDLNLISQKINSFSDDIDNILNNSPDNKKSKVFQWITLFILIFILIFIVLRCYCKQKAKRNLVPAIEASRDAGRNINNIFHICFKNQTETNFESGEGSSTNPSDRCESIECTPIRRSARLNANINPH